MVEYGLSKQVRRVNAPPLGLLFLLLFATGLGTGASCTNWYCAIHPKIEEISKFYPVYRDVVQKEYIEVEKPVVVEMVKEMPIELKQFKSPAELKEWLKQDLTNELPNKFEIDGVVFELDCDDYSSSLQEHANKVGYLVNMQIYDKGNKLPMKTDVLESAHAVNSTIIGNDVWLIEPQTDEAWKAYEVD